MVRIHVRMRMLITPYRKANVDDLNSAPFNKTLNFCEIFPVIGIDCLEPRAISD